MGPGVKPGPFIVAGPAADSRKTVSDQSEKGANGSHESLQDRRKYEARNLGTGNRRGRNRLPMGRVSDGLDDGARTVDNHSFFGVNTMSDRISHIFSDCRCGAEETTGGHAPERLGKG